MATQKSAAGKKVHAAVSQPLPYFKRQQPKGTGMFSDAVTVKRQSGK
jgi:hypothetical protein